MQGVLSSLLADFAIRSARKGNIHGTTLNRLPMVPLDHPLLPNLILPNPSTSDYSSQRRTQNCGHSAADERFLDDPPILQRYDEHPIGPAWTPDTPLRRAVDRRNAQVEIDVLVALMLDVPIEDLCTLYEPNSQSSTATTNATTRTTQTVA